MKPARGEQAIVIGAGHNGLVCAALLARAGRRVLVLEAADVVGGASVTREFAPGFRVSACAHLLHMLPRSLVDELALKRHGLRIAGVGMPTTALSEAGEHVCFDGASVTGASELDARAYAALMARLRRMAAHLSPLLHRSPPRLGTTSWVDRAALLRLAWEVRRLGRADMRELLRIIGMNVYDLAEEQFESAALRAIIAFDAVLGANAGPRGPGTVLTLLYRLAAEADALAMAQPAGGMGAVAEAFASAARAAGATIRTHSRVARIVVQNDRAAGVQLADGEMIVGDCVISGADPRTTFLSLLGSAYLDTGFVRRVLQWRNQGLAAKLHLALSGAPAFRGLDKVALSGRLIVAPSPEYLERAYNASKYGECSQAPSLEVVMPTMTDASLAPAGQHVLSAIVQYAPYAPSAGWAALREGFAARVIDILERHAPGLRSQIVAAELLTPEDLEARFGMAGGHWHHGELAFDQFFMVRPVVGCAKYSTPLAGLYLCGAGSHPGGGVMGAAGRNAARHVLAGG